MIMRIEDKVITDLEFRQALNLEKKPSSYIYGCPIHQIKTEAYCPDCKSVVQANRIWLEQPVEKVRISELQGQFTSNLPIWSMVENGYGYVVPNAELEKLLLERKQPIQFKYIEKAGLNARELDNFIFIDNGKLIRIRCDLDTKSLLDYSQATAKKEKISKKKAIIVKKKLPIASSIS